MGELYRLDFASGKSYIGITRRTAVERFADHSRAARRSEKGVVYKAWKKYGSPTLVVLAKFDTETELYVAERSAIIDYGTRFPAGYNFTDGGDVPPSLSPEVAAKIAAKLKGKKLSPERCEAIRLMRLGRKASPESKAKMSIAQRGKSVSEPARIAMSAAKIGRKLPPETLAKMAEAQRARRRAEGFEPQKPRINYPRKPKQPLALRRAA